MVKLLRRIINLFKKCKMAKINNTAAYAISSPVVGTDIVIGSALGNNGDTKNFQMSDILTYIMSSSTLTLQDVCDNGSSTTTGITVAGTTTLNGTVDINNTADISGNTTIGGTLGVTGVSTLDSVAVTNNATVGGTLGVTGVSTLGEIDASGVADIADTLTLSKATGTGLQVDADANIDGSLTVTGFTTFQDTVSFADANSISAAGVISTAGNIVALGTVFGSFLAADPANAPASASATGTTGSIVADADYIYVCTATNTWKRVAIATW
jgi:hypothetical protein